MFLLFILVLNFGAALQGAPSVTTDGRETLSLDGSWQIVFDRKNVGRVSKWQVQTTFETLKDKKTIVVPNCWETIEQDYEGAAWYGRSVTIPAAWKDKVIRLQFGAVNYRAEVWVNDQPAGFHEGGYTPFELTVGDLLRPGKENFIAVRVLGPVLTNNTFLDGIGPNETPHWRGAIAGGIWQSVQFTATDELYVSDVFVAPDIHQNRAVIRATVVNSTRKIRPALLEFVVDGVAGGVRRDTALQPGNNLIEAEVRIPNAKLWSPEQPHLYTLRAGIRSADRVVDSVQRRFGMREFVLRGNSYFLNGKKTFIKAGFWEGFYPRTLAFPADAEVVRREIRLAKEAGFNVLRPWRKPPVPMILDLADEMGIMLIGAPPVECMNYWPQLAPETEQRIAIEVREMVLRDRNHPSVIYWELFNEVVRPGLGRLKHGMSLLARELDPTRIIIDESGGWADGAHAYPPYGREPEAINEIHSYLPAPVAPRTYDFYLSVGRPGSDTKILGGRNQLREGMVFVSEVGYGGLPDLPANVERYMREGNPLTPDYRFTRKLLDSIQQAMRELGWSELFSDAGALCRASQRVQAEGNRLQLEALRLNPHVAGYCLHAYTDGDWVIGAGLLDLFREPKLSYHTVKRVQAPVYVAIQVDPPNLREGQAARLRIQSVNEGDPVRGRLEWEVAGPNGRIVRRDQTNVSTSAGIATLLETQLPSLVESGTYRARVRFRTEAGAEYENEHEFFSLAKKELAPPAAPFAVFDPGREITPFLEARGIRFREFTGKEDLPVIVTAETPRNAATFRRFVELMDYVERGGVAIFLRPPALRIQPNSPVVAKVPENPLLRTGLFPFPLRLRPARGNWVPVNHGVRPHPIFEDLPVKDFMGQAYLNVCANETLEGIKAAPIVGSLTFSWGQGSEQRNYLGPREVWWGADMVDVPHGKGRMLLSTLHLIENLEKDPVAEKLLYNMVRWSASVGGHVEPVGAELQRKLETYKPE
jgi:beta-galactosidase